MPRIRTILLTVVLLIGVTATLVALAAPAVSLAADVTPPVTSDNADALWHRHSVTVALTPTDAAPAPDPGAVPGQVITDGNSMTAGHPYEEAGSLDPTAPYPAQLQVLLGAPWLVDNLGVDSQDIDGMAADAAIQIDPLYDAARPQNIVVVWEGTNEIYYHDDGASAATKIANYCTARRAVGFKVIVLTILPRSGGSTPADFETQRQICNTGIRTDWTGYADAIDDVAADSRIGDAGDEMNATYYLDRVHMTKAGNGVIASSAEAAIASVVNDPSGVASTSYRVDGQGWSAGATVKVEATADHTKDGVHLVEYYSTDNAGNAEAPRSALVRIDTRGPSCKALSSARATRGSFATLRYRVNDRLSPTAHVVIKIRRLGGSLVRTYDLGTRKTGRDLAFRVKCAFAPRTYRYVVYATDLAGNHQATTGVNTLIVK